ncbi:MAG: elongation factor P [Candidatus Schekmanbacteria bacterium RBG_13_48_7]|uniref:Elongation factor P n=1 Tax=Candidatus Schekmanbacteria bacterium RBG_13_48_7 TaxID=1817878 RepID=A0A1F7RNM7_9BACT|nr:MAG: elongation factor P [Candidatus Schekmanbacteria bacterium RBG_13_48_7]
MISTSDFRNGLKIEYEGEPFVIVDFQHVKPGKGTAFVRTKFKNLKTGLVLERNFRSGDKFEIPDIEELEMQYLYADGDQYCMMDQQNYEQRYLSKDQLGDSRLFMKENCVVKILFYRGEPIGVDLPTFVELEIVKSEPGIKGDRASGATKQAELSTGATVLVPLFINEGDVIKIDTRTGQYIERVG